MQAPPAAADVFAIAVEVTETLSDERPTRLRKGLSLWPE